mgnify:CR=1 FL=1
MDDDDCGDGDEFYVDDNVYSVDGARDLADFARESGGSGIGVVGDYCQLKYNSCRGVCADDGEIAVSFDGEFSVYYADDIGDGDDAWDGGERECLVADNFGDWALYDAL